MASSIVIPAGTVDPDEVTAQFDKSLLEGVRLSGFEDNDTKRLLEAQHILAKGKGASFKALLPLLLSLNGEPYTLDRRPGKHAKRSPGYFPFETFYRMRMPRKVMYKTGRQVAKSTNLAARGIVHSNAIPYFSTLYVTPLYEMIRRFSQNYVRPFIETSPVKALFIGSDTVNSVLQRTFNNRSKMIFSFAFTDCDRTRGISANKVSYDEVQDLDKDHIPIIRETMSGSPYGVIEEYAGTPKSLENTIQKLWKDSSQAEWVMKCFKCGHWNVPARTHDLDDMIGPYSEDISYERPGIVCGKCHQPKSVFPQFGRWVHARPEKRWDFAGYHVPQILMPMHYASREKWSMLLGKREGQGNTPEHVYYNEVLGESSDTGSRIITLSDLERACVLPWPRDLTRAVEAFDPSAYVARVLACDWGGGGQDGMSYTVYSVMGMRVDGKIDVIFAYRSLTPHEHEREAKLAVGLAYKFKCHAIAHDYTGAGSLRETFIIQAGYPLERVLPVAYVRVGATSRIMQFKPGSKNSPRSHYQVDKTRSLLLTCNQIKNGWIRFFQDDYHHADDEGLIRDFLALVDEKVDSRLGKDVYTIIRDPNLRDDFAQATNVGACALWNMTDKWPNVAAIAKMAVPYDLLNAMHPEDKDVMRELL